MPRRREAVSESYYSDVLSKAEEILRDACVQHRFVGGVIVNPIDLKTTVEIDPLKKTAILGNHKPLALVRSDGSVRDIDAIGFSPYKDTYKVARRKLKEEKKAAHARGLPYPPISVEPTGYSHWRGRNKLLQFVSTLDVDGNNELHLTFGGVDQITPWATMDPWNVTFENGLQLTSINPYGLLRRYEMRNASGLKKKDRQPEVFEGGTGYSKIDTLAKFCDSVRQQALMYGIDYAQEFETWDQFIDNLQNHPDPVTRAKAIGTRVYWDTIGTTLAHGKGIFKYFANLGDRFTG